MRVETRRPVAITNIPAPVENRAAMRGSAATVTTPIPTTGTITAIVLGTGTNTTTVS
ncbi:hypothetical protein [Parvibaculum sp.]|uniref:hypothetical protein n=1 Tax=Parvibaculum sp. TaxID=2024848 RepID=UPI003919077E